MPKLLDLLPEYQSPKDSSAMDEEMDATLRKLGAQLQSDDDEQSEASIHPQDEDGLDTSPPTAPPYKQRPKVVECGEMPPGLQLEDFHDPPLKSRKTNAEFTYWRDFAVRAKEAFVDVVESSDVTPTRAESWHITSGDALGAAERQSEFFKNVDKFDIEPN